MDFDLYRLSLESIEEQESDTVLLYHFQDWPRHAVPNNGLRGITNMYQEVMRSNINQQPSFDTVRVISRSKLYMYNPTLAYNYNSDGILIITIFIRIEATPQLVAALE